MNTFEEVTKMKQEGKAENEIIQALQEQKVPPKQIVDALEQADIKKAVTGETQQQEINYDMVPAPSPTNAKEQTAPKMEPLNSQEQESYYQPEPGNAMPTESYGNYEQYPEYDNSYDTRGGGTSSDTLIDIAEQVYTEKSKRLLQKIDALGQFKSMAEIKLESIETRLKRMERIMDQLQLKIIDKVGSYGTNIELIKKEMTMIEESFSKMLKPLTRKKKSSKK